MYACETNMMCVLALTSAHPMLWFQEFVHGDFGRTRPSVGDMLGCACDILQLDVVDVDMDFDTSHAP